MGQQERGKLNDIHNKANRYVGQGLKGDRYDAPVNVLRENKIDIPRRGRCKGTVEREGGRG